MTSGSKKRKTKYEGSAHGITRLAGPPVVNAECRCSTKKLECTLSPENRKIVAKSALLKELALGICFHVCLVQVVQGSGFDFSAIEFADNTYMTY
jgi:hypothetical protein